MWTLHVEDFGRIEKADITVSPLTLFVGDNNSGKSYLLTLIYGLMGADDDGVLSNLCEDSEEYRACAEWAEKALEQGKQSGDVEIPFDDYVYTIFENLWNRILENNQADILRSIFNAELSAGKISVTFSRFMDDILYLNVQSKSSVLNDKTAVLNKSRYLNVQPQTVVSVLLSFCFYGVILELSLMTPEVQIRRLLGYVLEALIMRSWKTRLFAKISFLPTARTGFLVTYPALTKDAFSRGFGPNQKRNVDLSLTRPFTDFLGDLTTVNKKDISEDYQPIIDFIESNIIHGKILVSNDLPLPEFYYLPDNMKTSLPMFLSSDVVKEITPLILMLQYKEVDTLFIEEPEMNLHLELQQIMARTLIKLVNAGASVIAATHSDTILQHVNNMVKLNNLPETRKQTLMERFNFGADDPISADKISMYQFDVQTNGKTVVQTLPHGDYGFEVPTFYNPLETLLEQTRATEPDAEEYED